TVNPGGSLSNTYAYSINDSGQFVGSYTNSSGNNDGFLYSGGIYTTIDPPGSASTVAHGINASGKIVGYYTDNGANYHGFLDSGGVYTTIDPPASTYTIVNSINSYGQIAGYYKDSSGNRYGFLDSGGVYTRINDPLASKSNGINDSGTVIYGINNAGEAVGFYIDNSSNYHGFLASGGVYTTIDPPGSTY